MFCVITYIVLDLADKVRQFGYFWGWYIAHCELNVLRYIFVFPDNRVFDVLRVSAYTNVSTHLNSQKRLHESLPLRVTIRYMQ